MSWVEMHHRQVLENISNVQASRTAEEAEEASWEGLEESFLFRGSSSVLTTLWTEGIERYGPPSDPWPESALDDLKAAFVARLRESLVSDDLSDEQHGAPLQELHGDEDGQPTDALGTEGSDLVQAALPTWDENESLAEVAGKVEDAYLNFDRKDRLSTLPASIIQRCWSEAETADGDAVRILIFRYQWGLETSGTIEHGIELKRLLDMVCLRSGESVNDIGHALISSSGQGLRSHLYATLQNQERYHGLRIHELNQHIHENPMIAIEEAYFGLDRSEHDHLIGSLLMAGYRALLLEYQTSPMRLFTVLMGLREAYGLFRAKRPELAEGSVRWCGEVIDDGLLGSSLPEETRNVLGECYLGAAIAAENGNYRDQQVVLLERALGFFEKRGNEYAGCCFRLAEEFQRRGRLIEALDKYTEADRAEGVDDKELKVLVRMSLGMLRAELEGNFSKFSFDPETLLVFGHDPQFGVVMQQLLTASLARTEPSQEDLLAGVQVLREMIARFIDTSQPADRILKIYHLAIGIALSVNDPSRLPDAVATLVAEADRFVANAKPETVAKYEQIKAIVRHTL